MKRLIKTRDEREQIAKLARHERRLFRTKYQQLLQTMQLRLDTDYQTGLIAALESGSSARDDSARRSDGLGEEARRALTLPLR